jgi:hypothetical protein
MPSNTHIKEKLMVEAHAYHLPNSTAIFNTGVDHLGQVEALRHHYANILILTRVEVGKWQ